MMSAWERKCAREGKEDEHLKTAAALGYLYANHVVRDEREKGEGAGVLKVLLPPPACLPEVGGHT
jgi:hypothetical protein